MKKDDLKLAIQSLISSYICVEVIRNQKHTFGSQYKIVGFDSASEKIMEFLDSIHLTKELDYEFEHAQRYERSDAVP